ncbi:MAG: LPS export ABC transporter permease LptG [Methylococcaceae bacterium]|nr:LPS export ABC transporter permease LptG [Methylococcaceae bacterium]
MDVLNRYIAKEILKGSVVASLILLSLSNFFTFTDELRDIGDGTYSLKDIFVYLGLTSPRDFYELLPSATLLGSLVTLGGLGNNRELIAMQSAGASKFQIIWAVIRGGLILTIFSSMIGEYIAPPSERAANEYKSIATQQQVASRTRYGFWLRDGNVFINIRQIQKQEELGDISIFELDENRHLKLVTHANKAIYEGTKWRLDDIKITHVGHDNASGEAKPNSDWDTILAPELLNVFVVNPENLSAQELWNYMDYLERNGQKNLNVELAFWGRIVNPFVTLTMLLVATPFVMTLRRETSLGQRIVVGVTFGLGFYLFDRVFGHFCLIYEANPIFSASFPTLLVLSGTLVAIARMR